MAYFLLNKYEFAEIIETYEITETEGIRLLARLDRTKIIELPSGNRVKLLVSTNFKWVRNGPIQRFSREMFNRIFSVLRLTGHVKFAYFYRACYLETRSISVSSRCRFRCLGVLSLTSRPIRKPIRLCKNSSPPMTTRWTRVTSSARSLPTKRKRALIKYLQTF